MTPKEKAKQLFDNFYSITPLDADFSDSVDEANRKILSDRKHAKQCALIAVDEIINNDKNMMRGLSENLHDEYWQEVKKEICDL